MASDPVTTRLLDKNGREIKAGALVSLAGNITADDSMGPLPNGWVFDTDDVYRVVFDVRIGAWSLALGVEPNSALNRKYMNHAIGLLHDGLVEVVEEVTCGE